MSYILMTLLFRCRLLGSYHTYYAYQHKRNAEQLSHVQQHISLKLHLLLLQKLNKETKEENRCQTIAKVETCAYGQGTSAPSCISTSTDSYLILGRISRHRIHLRLIPASVQENASNEDENIGNSFIELSRVAGHQLSINQSLMAVEDESPSHISRIAYYLRVHQIAESYACSCNRNSNCNIVQYCPYSHFVFTTVYHEGDKETYRATMTCQTLITSKMPLARRSQAERNKHLDKTCETGEVVPRLVEYAMSKASTNQDTKKTVKE